MKRNLPEPTPFIGQVVPGREQYRIERVLGTGCNAHVFLAHSDSLVHDVACKVIPVANLVGPDETPPRWREEIQKANRVSSTRVVKCHDTGEWSFDNVDYVFLLSDFVQGESLRDYLKRVKIVDVGFIESFRRADAGLSP